MLSFRDKVTQKFSHLFPNSSTPQDSPFSEEGKPLSSYLSYIIPSISSDGSKTSKHQRDLKPIQSASTRYSHENFEYQDVPTDNYVDCSPTCNNMNFLKDDNINEDHTSRRSSSSSEVFEEANEQTPKISKKSPFNLTDDSTFISPELYEFLEICLPNIVKGRQWVLLYSTLKHGVSLRTLIRKSAELSSPGLLIVGDMQGAVFGGLLDCPLKPTAKRKYQGTNQTFVFTTVYGQPRLFLPTGVNRYYYMCLSDLLALGGGGNYALCLEEDLLSGTSGPSDTFGNTCLAHSPEFELKNVEEEISSPLSARIFELCNTDFFPEALPNSEVTSSSNCCYEENSSYATTNMSLTVDVENKLNSNSNTVTTPTSTTTNNNTTNSSNLSIIFDSQEEIDNDISASIDFSLSPSFTVPPLLPMTSQQEQFDFSSVHPQVQLAACSVVEGFSQYPTDSVAPSLMGAPLPSLFDEDCISSVPSYVSLNPSSPCTYLSPGMPPYMPPAPLTTALSTDSSGLFGGTILLGSELQTQELDYQGENGRMYCADSIQRVFNPQDLQGLGTESQQLVPGAGSSATLTPEISNLEDSSFKVGKLSVEQRKEKINRYMKKRNERNFSKKIKYACRKTLADSRPRVRGRFAKNDDFGETNRTTSSNHEEDDEEEVVVKDEDDMVDSSDIFAHISGVNSFKCNYSIQDPHNP
ncbi:Oxidation resistance protein 1, partial [Mucuna pruriens]